MGYLTHFTLEYRLPAELDVLDERAGPILDEVIQSVIDRDENLKQAYDGDGEDFDWHHYDEDMKRLSELFPGVVFVVSGIGQDNFDYWQHYWQGGERAGGEVEFIWPERPFTPFVIGLDGRKIYG